jgi:hypothetical protein
MKLFFKRALTAKCPSDKVLGGYLNCWAGRFRDRFAASGKGNESCAALPWSAYTRAETLGLTLRQKYSSKIDLAI